jgi:hypothetical protein
VTKRLLVDATVILGAGIDIISFPAGNLGMQLMANSLSVTPASNITDGTYIGDIRFGESLPTGSNVIGAVTQSGVWNIGTLTSITNAISANCTQITSPWIISGSVNATCTATNLDIRDLTSVSDSILIYGSDDGGTTKRVIKTDSGGAIQVDLEVASVTVTNAGGASAVNIQDGGNTITVDGTISANCTQTTSPWVISGAVTCTQTTNPWTVNLITGFSTETTLSAINNKLVSGTDIGDVTINNANGASAVNIQDGGNTITIDGTVSANCTQTTSPWVISGNVTSNSANIATETTLSAINTKLVSGTDIGDVTINNANGASAVNIQDGGNTITVDGTVTANQGGSPWQVQSNSVSISTEATLKGVAGLVLTTYDYIALTYTGTNLTGVVFKTGGVGGTTVSTLTLAYTGSRLDTVTKT